LFENHTTSLLHRHAGLHTVILPPLSSMSIPLAHDEPLARPEYLIGPIETIVCSHQGLVSGHFSLHDITEAYRTLSMRIRQSSGSLSIASGPLLALGPLRENSANVATALRRDILRNLRAFTPHTPCDMRPSSSVLSEGGVDREPATYNVNYATDVSTQCHYVLRLLSEIFRFPALLSVFSRTSHFPYLWILLTTAVAQDLGFLFGDVISIICCPQLPTFNVSKTTILASWVVRTQRLPADILLPQMGDVILCLERLLEATVRDPSVNVTVMDALNVCGQPLQPLAH
jgi:hypothetical protein